MDVNDFDFDLPENLIAQTPLQDRTASRLMVLDKETGEVEHRHFLTCSTSLRRGIFSSSMIRESCRHV